MPILKFKTKEEIPADFHEIAKEADGGFEINVVSSAKLDSFRENNIAVSKERDELKKFRETVTPLIGDKKVEEVLEEVKALRAIDQKVKDGSLKTSEAIEGELTKRTDTMRATLEAQIAAQANEAKKWKEAAETVDSKYKMAMVDNAINNLVVDNKIGLNPKALPDVMARARAVFEVQADGSLVPKRNGEILRGEDGTSPMTPTEWLKQLRKEADYYFLGSNGGGATGESGSEGKIGGMTQAELAKLSPMERLKRINAHGNK